MWMLLEEEWEQILFFLQNAINSVTKTMLRSEKSPEGCKTLYVSNVQERGRMVVMTMETIFDIDHFLDLEPDCE